MSELAKTNHRGEPPIASIDDGLLYHKLRPYAPKGLQQAIMQSDHDSRIAGHFGKNKTIELIKRNFWWPHMKRTITEYVQSCVPWKQDQARRHRKYGLLSPLEIPHAPCVTPLRECTQLHLPRAQYPSARMRERYGGHSQRDHSGLPSGVTNE